MSRPDADSPPDVDAFEQVVFFTGAGLSAECGLPTYRGAGGIWSTYDYESYACQRAFDRDPARVWAFHDVRREVMGSVEPGPAHRAMARLQAERPATRIVTQNIDGLHQRAGASDVIELHGSVWRLRCQCPGPPRENTDRPLSPKICPDCKTWYRPDIVWFEDPMPSGPLEAAMDALTSCDLLVSIGTSGVVYPAAGLPRLAQGALRIEVNPEETPVSDGYELHLRGGAGEMLRRLWPRLF